MGSGRKGGLQGLDPAVQAWRKEAADNPAALTRKQKLDRKRTRVRYDVPQYLKDAVAEQAERISTSQSQMGAFLLAWALHQLIRGDEEITSALWRSREPVSVLQFDYDIKIPGSIEDIIGGHTNE